MHFWFVWTEQRLLKIIDTAIAELGLSAPDDADDADDASAAAASASAASAASASAAAAVADDDYPQDDDFDGNNGHDNDGLDSNSDSSSTFLRVNDTYLPISDWPALHSASNSGYAGVNDPRNRPRGRGNNGPKILELPFKLTEEPFPTTSCYVIIGTVGAKTILKQPPWLICAVPGFPDDDAAVSGGVVLRYIHNLGKGGKRQTTYISRQEATRSQPILRKNPETKCDDELVILFDEFIYKYKDDEGRPLHPMRWKTMREDTWLVQLTVPSAWARANGQQPPAGIIQLPSNKTAKSRTVMSSKYTLALGADFFAGRAYMKRQKLSCPSRATTAQKNDRCTRDMTGLSVISDPSTFINVGNLRSELLVREVQGLGATKVSRRDLANLDRHLREIGLKDEERKAVLYRIFADLSWQLQDNPVIEPDRIKITGQEFDHDFVTAELYLNATTPVEETNAFLEKWELLLGQALAGPGKLWGPDCPLFSVRSWFSEELLKTRDGTWLDDLKYHKNKPKYRCAFACGVFKGSAPFDLAVEANSKDECTQLRETIWNAHVQVSLYLEVNTRPSVVAFSLALHHPPYPCLMHQPEKVIVHKCVAGQT